MGAISGDVVRQSDAGQVKQAVTFVGALLPYRFERLSEWR